MKTVSFDECELISTRVLAARARANQAACLSTERAMGHAIRMYADDYDDMSPPLTYATFQQSTVRSPVRWGQLLVPYFRAREFCACPARQLPSSMARFAGSPDVSGYAWNGWLSAPVHLDRSSDRYDGLAAHALGFPALTVTVFEARTGIVSQRRPDTTRYPYGIFSVDFLRDIEAQTLGSVRHNGGSDYLFADGHAKWMLPQALKKGRTCNGYQPGFGI